VSDMMKRRPQDPELYKLRSQVRFRVGQYMDGLEDLERATLLNPENAELFYTLGVASYEVAAKHAEGSTEQKRELIRRGLAAFERAESLRADYFESLTYRSLLLREQAKLESDSAVRQKIIEEADAVRQRAVDLVKARRGKPAPAEANTQPSSSNAGPFRVGGDVKAPVIRHRVEPVIPEAARNAHIAGIVILETVIDKEGRVRDAKVMKGLPFGLDQAALEA
jgi:tetratricopeptide (TPR) repeat protein